MEPGLEPRFSDFPSPVFFLSHHGALHVCSLCDSGQRPLPLKASGFHWPNEEKCDIALWGVGEMDIACQAFRYKQRGRVPGKFQGGNDSISCDFSSDPAQDRRQQASPEWNLLRGLLGVGEAEGEACFWGGSNLRVLEESTGKRGEGHVRDNPRPASFTG